MTNEEMDRAIAQAVGWKPTADGGICWDGEGNAIITPPAYSTDLNAMRDARAALKTATQKTNFVVHLHRIIAADPLRNNHPWDLIDAQPEHQAQAFVRTIGKYSDATAPLP